MASKTEIKKALKKIEKLEKRINITKKETEDFFKKAKKLGALSNKQLRDFLDDLDLEIEVMEDLLEDIKGEVRRGFVWERDMERLKDMEAELDQIQILRTLGEITMEDLKRKNRKTKKL